MSAQKYRKKPVEIEAIRFNKPYTEVTEFCPHVQLIRGGRGQVVYGIIATLDEGEMRAEVGDWIIRGVQGEFYPCKPDIFEATYEQVSP